MKIALTYTGFEEKHQNYVRWLQAGGDVEIITVSTTANNAGAVAGCDGLVLASNMRLLRMLMAVMLSFAAIAFTPLDAALSTMIVPFASGSIVFNSFTGMLYCCAGQMDAGCKIFAPK